MGASFNYRVFKNKVTTSVVGIDKLISVGLGQWAIFGNLSGEWLLFELKCYFSQKHTNSNRKQAKRMLLRARGTSTVGFPAAMANAASCTVEDCGLVATIALFSYHAPGQPYYKQGNILQHNHRFQACERWIQKKETKTAGLGNKSSYSGVTSEALLFGWDWSRQKTSATSFLGVCLGKRRWRRKWIRVPPGVPTTLLCSDIYHTPPPLHSVARGKYMLYIHWILQFSNKTTFGSSVL